MKKKTLEQKKSIYCVLNGHSNVVETCFGYVTCARCKGDLGDTLLGTYNNPDVVIVGHKCKTCNANLKKLTRKDTTYLTKEIKKEIGL